METYQSHILEWAGLSIEVRYSPDLLESYAVTYSYPLAHIEIRSANREPLPVTDTGVNAARNFLFCRLNFPQFER